MEAKELVKSQVDDSGFQLNQVLSGFPADRAESKAGNTMTPHQIVDHLTECYLAFGAANEGQQYEWGTYRSPGTWDTSVAAFHRERAKAETLVESLDETGVRNASAYIIAHDYYHVGQLVSARIAADPDWDANSIYRW